MASRNMLGWRKKMFQEKLKKKMFQEERGLEITGKLKTRKHALSKKLKIKSNIVP